MALQRSRSLGRLVLFACVLFSSCSGGGGSSSGSGSTPVNIGGTISGLTGTLVLQNNGGDDLVVIANGPFVFPTQVADGSAYNVTVLTPPVGQACAITNASGIASGQDIDNVLVSCVNGFSVGGVMSGLNGSVVLQNNGGDDLVVTANGPFAFPTPLSNGTAYDITVLNQPPDQICTITDGSGIIMGAPVTDVIASCAEAFSVGGMVTGLSGTLVVQNNGGDDLTLTADGSFVFPALLPDGAPYSVSVVTQPDGQLCTITGGSGSVDGSDVNSVMADCVNTFAVGGTVTGLDGVLRLQNNGGDEIQLSMDGPFVFPERVVDGEAYEVTVVSPPIGQTCLINAGGARSPAAT